MWVLFQISFRPQQEIGEKLGDGRTIHNGPSFERLRYMLNYTEMGCVSGHILQFSWKWRPIAFRIDLTNDPLSLFIKLS